MTLHGLAGPAALRARARRDSVSMLAEYGFCVVSLDLPGFGLSAIPDRLQNIGDYPAWLSDFLHAVELDIPVNFVGTSMGGGIALLFAYQLPHLARRIVIVGSTRLDVSQPRLISDAKDPPEDAVRAMFHDQRVADEYLSQGVLDNSLQDIHQFEKILRKLGPLTLSLRKQLPEIRIPTLVVWGEQDQISPIANAQEFARLIPNSAARHSELWSRSAN